LLHGLFPPYIFMVFSWGQAWVIGIFMGFCPKPAPLLNGSLLFPLEPQGPWKTTGGF